MTPSLGERSSKSCKQPRSEAASPPPPTELGTLALTHAPVDVCEMVNGWHSAAPEVSRQD